MTFRPAARWVAALLLLFLAGAPLTAQPSPKLIVLVVVDQMATWVYEASRPHWGPGGFRRLEAEGVRFRQSAFAHSCTQTGPGHASIATGAIPLHHGIVANNWLDLEKRRRVYCCEDDTSPIVGAPGAGRSPIRLQVPTFGDTLKAHRGDAAKVVSVGWKDRSAIMMGGRAGDAVIWMESGGFATSRFYAEALPEWVVAYNSERPWERWFDQTWDRLGPETAYAGLIDDRAFETVGAEGGRTLPRPLRGKEEAPSAKWLATLQYTFVANELVYELALRAIQHEKLGADDTPDLLCIGLAANDLIGHATDPSSVEVRDITLRTDDLVRRLLVDLDRTVGEGRYVVVLSADHGITPSPQSLALQRQGFRGGIVEKAAMTGNAALVARFGAPLEPALRYVIGADDTSLWLDRAALDAKSIDLAVARRIVAEGARTAPNVFLALPREELSLATPDPLVRAIAGNAHPLRTGDVYFIRPAYAMEGSTTATHGSPFTFDREVPLVVSGPGLAADTIHDGPVTPGIGVVVASYLLGIPAPAAAHDPLPTGVIRSPR